MLMVVGSNGGRGRGRSTSRCRHCRCWGLGLGVPPPPPPQLQEGVTGRGPEPPITFARVLLRTTASPKKSHQDFYPPLVIELAGTLQDGRNDQELVQRNNYVYVSDEHAVSTYLSHMSLTLDLLLLTKSGRTGLIFLKPEY